MKFLGQSFHEWEQEQADTNLGAHTDATDMENIVSAAIADTLNAIN